MALDLLTPEGAALALLVVAPLAARAATARRAELARRALRLGPPGPEGAAVALALIACAGLLGLAAAQPVLIQSEGVQTRTDAEAIAVVDTSRSMRAAPASGEETRFERARDAAERLADALPEVPIGLASMTDRVLPHSFPSARRELYLAALTQVLGVERPPPQTSGGQISSLGALAQVAQGEFFSPEAGRRLLFVLTDGESQPFDQEGLAAALGDAGIEALLVRVWRPGEVVRDRRGRREAAYLADPASAETVAGLGSLLGGGFEEDDLGDAIQAARDYLGSGPVASVKHEVGAVQLAPWAVLAALVPLGFVLWRAT